MKRTYQGGTRAATPERIASLRLRFEPNETVLDLGCNKGEFCGLLTAAGLQATGVDLRPPAGSGFLRLDLNLGLAASFASVGVGRFDHVLALSVWKYVHTPTMVDLISFYARKSATIEFNPGIWMTKSEVQELFKRSGLVVSEMWKTSDRFERLVVRLINQRAEPAHPPHILHNRKTGIAQRLDSASTLSLDAIRSGQCEIKSRTVVMLKRTELLALRSRRRLWKPLKSWWRDAWVGRPLTGQEKKAWLTRSCRDEGWDWKRPAHVAFRRSTSKFKLVNGCHRVQLFQGELVPTLVTYLP